MYKQRSHTCNNEHGPTDTSSFHVNVSIKPSYKFVQQQTSTTCRALLKTAIANVESPEKRATAHILSEEGAQRSFITEALAKKLNLTADKTETLHLSVFGGDQTTVKEFDVATVNLQTDNGQTIPIRVVVIPVIAAPQKNHVTTAIRDLPYLKSLKLAHPVTNHEQFTITLLIGADHYWDIVEGEIIRRSGPTAAKSKIGTCSLDQLSHIFQHWNSTPFFKLSLPQNVTKRPWNGFGT